MSTTSQPPLSFEEFRHLLATELQVEEARITPHSSFTDDLMVDSIRMVQLMLRLEEMGITIPPEVAWDIQTLEDAYRCYLQYQGPSRSPSDYAEVHSTCP